MLPDGTRDILGLWLENPEGAKVWLKLFNALKTRGVNDIPMAATLRPIYTAVSAEAAAAAPDAFERGLWG